MAIQNINAEKIKGTFSSLNVTGNSILSGTLSITGIGATSGLTNYLVISNSGLIYSQTGSAGPQGYQGATGPQGATGSQGLTGATGATGLQGATGANGSQGPQGVNGTYSGYMLQRLAGSFSGLSMSGTPLTYNVVLPVTFTNQYIVNIECATPRTWTIDTKSSTGFTVRSNSLTTITDAIYWACDDLTSGSLGIVQGATGPQGSNGLNGATGSTGPQGATGPQGVQGIQGPAPSYVETLNINDLGSSIPNQTYTLELYAEYSYNINELRIVSSSGTASATIKIAGSTVSGISGVTASSVIAVYTPLTTATVSVGNSVTMTLTNTNQLVNLQATIKSTRN